MKSITIDDELYAYIASQTKYIGEDASDILRRLLLPESAPEVVADEVAPPVIEEEPVESEVVEKPTPVVNNGAFELDPTLLADCSTVVERFLLILSLLHKTNAERFSAVLAIRGKGRDYFAGSKEQLLATGSSTNPKAIPDSAFWVVTNNNTSKKASILGLVAEALGYDADTQTSIKQALTAK